MMIKTVNKSMVLNIASVAFVAHICLGCQEADSGEEHKLESGSNGPQRSVEVPLENRLSSVLRSMKAARTPTDELRGVSGKPEGTGELLGMPSIINDCAGSPGNSWRYWVFALKRIDYESAYGVNSSPVFSMPWNEEMNADFVNLRPAEYCITERAQDVGASNVVTITGADSIYVSRDPDRWHNAPKNLIVLFTVRDMPYHWMQPGDIDKNFIRSQLERPANEQLLGIDESGIHVGFIDGDISILSRDIPFEVLEPFLSYEEAATSDRDQLLPYIVK